MSKDILKMEKELLEFRMLCCDLMDFVRNESKDYEKVEDYNNRLEALMNKGGEK